MVWLKKKHAGGAPGLTWESDGDVLDVPLDLALELLERPGDEFTEGEPPDGDGEPEKTEIDEPDPDAASDGETASAPKTKQRRTKVAE